MQSEIVHKLRAHQIMGLVFLSHAQMVTASHELPVGMYVLPEEVTFYVRLLLLPLSSTTNLSTSLSSLSSPPPPVLPLPTPLLTLSIPLQQEMAKRKRSFDDFFNFCNFVLAYEEKLVSRSYVAMSPFT